MSKRRLGASFHVAIVFLAKITHRPGPRLACAGLSCDIEASLGNRGIRMEAAFWHQRWEENRIGFHQA
ncbi:hypothetical protein ACLKQF_07900, partial [Aeromonas salmonicida]